MKLRKAISMKEYRRRRRARGFAGLGPRRLARRTRAPEARAPGTPKPEAKSPAWAKPLSLSPSLQVRAKEGTRAVVMPLRPGLFLVGEVAEGKVADGAQKVAGAMVKIAQGALSGDGEKAAAPRMPAARQLPAPRQPAPADPAEPGDDDFEGLFGCARCGRRHEG